jgi:L-amino acid N-acyltransferase YncA
MAAILRVARLEDAAAIRAIYAPHIATPASFELEIPTEAPVQERLRKAADRFPWLVCEGNSVVDGYAYASRHRERAAYDWSVEVSVYVGESSQRRGIGRALYTALLGCLRCQGYFSAFAGITIPNPKSVGFHEALGFRHLGVFHRIGFKCGAWHDVGWWELALAPYPSAPAPPLTLVEAVSKPEWSAALAAGHACLRQASV